MTQASLLARLLVQLLPAAGVVLNLEGMRDLVVAPAGENVAAVHCHWAHMRRSAPHELIAVPSARFHEGVAAHVVHSRGDEFLRAFIPSPICDHRDWIRILAVLVLG